MIRAPGTPRSALTMLTKNFSPKKIAAFFRSAQGILMATTGLSYALGLLRDRLFARTFGAGTELDAYQAAFLLPDFMLNFLIAGGLVAVFVPLFLEAKRKNPEHANVFAQTMATVSAALMLGIGLALFWFSPQLAGWVAPGFDANERELLVHLMRILSFSPTIFAASNAFGGILVAEKRFLTYGLSPVFYNGGIILGTVFLAPHWGIAGVAYGTIAGALLHLAVRIVELRVLHFPLYPAWRIRLPEFRPFLRLMLPKMFGHPVELATFWGFTAIASTLAPGSIAILNFARNFQSVPISLIGITLSTVSFSALSERHAARERQEFLTEFKKTLWHIAWLSIAAAGAIFILKEFIISLFIGGGAFGPDAIRLTAQVLGAFLISVPLEAVSHQLVRAFYATKNTLTPTVAGVVNLVLSVAGAWVLMPWLGLLALPLGYAVGSAAKIIMLAWLLPKQLDWPASV